nr:retrovirus-related Pol polyprotein from transposon TNT 1-94 [Tanacetum cinerariifolium]
MTEAEYMSGLGLKKNATKHNPVDTLSKALPTEKFEHCLNLVNMRMRPNLDHAVGVVSRFMANPSKAHWKAVKWILRYLKGGLNICLVYDGKGHGDGLVGYADFNYGADLVKRRSLTCFIFTLFGCAVSWKSTLQPTVTLPMTEAEYMSMTEGIKECIWLHC